MESEKQRYSTDTISYFWKLLCASEWMGLLYILGGWMLLFFVIIFNLCSMSMETVSTCVIFQNKNSKK